NVLSSIYERDYVTVPKAPDERDQYKTAAELAAAIARLEKDMRAAAANLEFEKAAALRDRLKRLRSPDPAVGGADGGVSGRVWGSGSRTRCSRCRSTCGSSGRSGARW